VEQGTHTPLHDLGEGLILRRATPADAVALAEHNSHIHLLPDKKPDLGVAAWTCDLMRGDHPTVRAGDFTIVEDTRNHRIASSLNLIPQRWSYAGVEFGVGRPELVGTLPEYRRRGLVRAQMDVIHMWSAERGDKVQAITGIPWYYRQFEYEMALSLGGGRGGFVPQHVPTLKEGEAEPYRVRPALEDDIPFMAEVYDHAAQRSLVSCIRDQALWRYELSGRSSENVQRTDLCIVETPECEPVGFFAVSDQPWQRNLAVSFYELVAGMSWLAVTPSVLRYLQATGEQSARRDRREFNAFFFRLGSEHPVFEAMPQKMPNVREPYAWYLRVPDVRDFVQTIVPVLEKRLEGSVVPRHTGELKISFYRDGVRLGFERGFVRSVEAWKPESAEAGDAAFPDRTFLQLLFGYRSFQELKHSFADCWVDKDETRLLLNVLFPKQPSNVWPVA
jgi:hypothetical protein